ATAERLGRQGFLVRSGQQFHWHNQGFKSFDDFLATFTSRKRKGVRREREQALGAGLSIDLVTGSDITEAHWDAMYEFYMDTGNRKWGQPYLNRAFFSLLGASMAERCLLVLVRRGRKYIAGALNLIGGDCLYGRYWGATEHHPCLHFEVCYYQAIDYAITHGLARVEPGAGGEHKLARGYLPTPTVSLHWFADERFSAAVADYLEREREAVEVVSDAYVESSPYRKANNPTGAAPDARAEDHY
ncbi:MAG: GNAT family N-acetyltransferase, partial [Gammaproteobacteria bacterium]